MTEVERGTLKKRFQQGGHGLGFWVEFFSPLATECLASCGYDFAMIDLEHGPGSYLDAIHQMQALKANNCPALARVPWNDHVAIKRILDAGAEGVMIPSVGTVGEARDAVAACKYPPEGRRGFAAGIIRGSNYGAETEDYIARVNDDTLVICQIETVAGCKAAEDIAAVDGVDMLFIGPMDLAADAGYLARPDEEEVLALRAEVEAAAKAHGKMLGSIETVKRPGPDLVRDGYSLVMTDSEATLLRAGAAQTLERFREF